MQIMYKQISLLHNVGWSNVDLLKQGFLNLLQVSTLFALQRTTIICMDCNRLVEAPRDQDCVTLRYVKYIHKFTFSMKKCILHRICFGRFAFHTKIYVSTKQDLLELGFLVEISQIQVRFSLVWTVDFQMAYPSLNISLQSISEAAETFLNVELSK